MQVVLAVLSLACLIQALCSGQVQRRDLDQDWVNQPETFFRREYQASLVLGHHLYIDGGVVRRRVNDSDVEITPVNQTYSIPLSTSWRPETVQFQRIDKGDDAPVHFRPNLWPAIDGSSFYSFNGGVPAQLKSKKGPPRYPELWIFEPDGDGGGTWKLESTTNTVTQSVDVACTAGNGSVYFLGGWQNWRTTQNLADHPNSTEIQSADGIVTYNMVTPTWSNDSITYSHPNGWVWEAQLHYLTGSGDEGLLLAMGGTTSAPGSIRGVDSLIDYNTVSMYNTVTNEWRNQTTAGDVPPGRGSSCSVGVRGDNGTFEIFLYGGEIGASSTTQSQVNIDLAQYVYVLSLPSFTWHRSTSRYASGTARHLHTCQAHNRQMLIVGGTEPGIAADNNVADPWPQGLGIYDLTSMTFKSSYDSSAGPYETPKQIKDYLAANGSYPQWNDDKVELWMTGRVARPNTTPGSNPSNPSPTSSPQSSSNIGAIAGGAVGGVVGALIVACLVWFILRRRRRTRPQAPHRHQPGFEKPELEAKDGYRREDHKQFSAPHHNGGYLPREPYGTQMQEMEGSSAEHELPVKSAR